MNIGVFIGITAGMVSVFLTVMMKSLRYQSFYENDRWLICGGLAVLGLVCLVAGFFSGPRSRPTLEEGELPSSPFLLTNVAYWGFLFLLFGGATALVSPMTHVAHAAQTKPANAITKPIVAINPKFSLVESTSSLAHATSATNQLVKLKLQGIAYDKVKPSAIINGRTYFVGEVVRDAKVVSIEQSEVVVEFMGQNRTLRLGQ